MCGLFYIMWFAVLFVWIGLGLVTSDFVLECFVVYNCKGIVGIPLGWLIDIVFCCLLVIMIAYLCGFV